MIISWLSLYLLFTYVMIVKPNESDSIQAPSSYIYTLYGNLNTDEGPNSGSGFTRTNSGGNGMDNSPVNGFNAHSFTNNYFPLDNPSVIGLWFGLNDAFETVAPVSMDQTNGTNDLADYTPNDSITFGNNGIEESEIMDQTNMDTNSTYQSTMFCGNGDSVALGSAAMEQNIIDEDRNSDMLVENQNHDNPLFLGSTVDEATKNGRQLYTTSLSDKDDLFFLDELDLVFISDAIESKIKDLGFFSFDFFMREIFSEGGDDVTESTDSQAIPKAESIFHKDQSGNSLLFSSNLSTMENNTLKKSGNSKAVKSYSREFKAKLSSFLENIPELKICSNYEKFLNMIPNLYKEIEDSLETNISIMEIWNVNDDDVLTFENYEDKIKKEIEKSKKIVLETDIFPEQISKFANKLIIFEKNNAKNINFPEQIQIISTIMEKIKNDKNLVIFYEILKFVYYYSQNLQNCIESGYILYVQFFLSVISERLDSFDNSFSTEYKICHHTLENKCEPKFLNEYLKKIFVQKLFCKLLLGMKNGKMRSRFYNVYFSHEICARTHHNSNAFYNQSKIFKFYLRVFISIVLYPDFNSEIEYLEKFIDLSFDIFTTNKFCKKAFTQSLEHLITNTSIKFYSMIKTNLEIIKPLILITAKNNGEFIINSFSELENKLSKNEILSMKYVFVSEVCLSWYLNKQYQKHPFGIDENYTSWSTIEKSLFESCS
ncbi:hypothetical protein CWI39_0788p0010 [Hamiltosporidium magnivora]|uniref:Uncharacterized protein n=1 Tax=Hamiltosporidium magnivora TaxID=148818 RepID=A0A4Q9LBZ7_9MICR|nr:hypothetical protein CWI39_0788p0010 [Hamiltosporidium magnivora]